MSRSRWWLAALALAVAVAFGAALVLWRAATPPTDFADHRAAASAGRSDKTTPRPHEPAATSLFEAEIRREEGALSIRGRVTADGAPVAGARVIATRDEANESLSARSCQCDNHCGQPLLECHCGEAAQQIVDLVSQRSGEVVPVSDATSDDKGEFELTGLDPGSLALWAEHAERGVALLSGVSAGATGVEVALAPGRTVAGRVVDEDDRPLSGVALTAVHRAESRFFDGVSNVGGHFELGPMPEGDLRIVAWDGVHLAEKADAPRGKADVRIEMTDPRTLRGLVLDGGAAAADVDIEARGEHRTETTKSAPDGSFSISGLRRGTYDLTARRGARGASAQALLTSRESQPITIELGELTAVQGTVRGPDGAPISGAEIRAFKAHPERRKPRSSATTGADGRYRVSLPPGSWSLTAEADGFLRETHQLSGDRLDFVLQRAAVLAGVVVDEAGSPIGDAMVWGRPSDDEVAEPAFEKTGGDGAFSLDLPDGPVQLHARGRGYKEHESKATAPSKGVRVVLERGGRITGTVLDEKEAPVPGAKVSASPADPKHPAAGSEPTVTDARGRFELSGLETGRHVVQALVARGGSRLAAEETADVDPSRTAEVVLKLAGGGEVHGVVVDARSQPLANARVWASPRDAAAEEYEAAMELYQQGAGSEIEGVRERLEATSDAGGRFVLRSVRGGTYSIRARVEGYRPAEPAFAKAGDRDVRVVLRRHTLAHGRVLGPDREPLTSFTVDATPVTAKDGRFHHPIDEDSFRSPLVVSAAGYASEHRPIEVRAGVDVDLGDIVMGAGRSVRGTVVDAATGAPVAGAKVILDEGHGPQLLRTRANTLEPHAITDAAGAFTLSRVPSSEVILAVVHRDYGTVLATIAATETRPTIRVRRPAVLTGRVLGADGKGVVTQVFAMDPAAAIFESARSGNDGVFHMALQAGSYHLRASEAAIESKTVNVPEHGEVSVVLSARKGATVTLRLRAGGGDFRGSAMLFAGSVDAASLAKMTSMPEVIAPRSPQETSFDGVPAGGYTVMVVETPRAGTMPRFLLRPLAVSNEPEQQVEIRFEVNELQAMPMQ